MIQCRSALAVLLVAGLSGASLAFLQPKPRASPPDVAGYVLNGNRISIYYARPSMKGRKIWGDLVPFGQVWRFGANEATLLTTQAPIELGGAVIPQGAHTLFFLPNEDGSAKLIVSKTVGQWGTDYKEEDDLVRIDVPKAGAPEKPVEQLTLSFMKADAGATLKIAWADREYIVPVMSKK